ncbi:MAG: polysulfide reductase NrfD [Gemmatimonadota bacterium]
MLDEAFHGGRRYWALVAVWAVLILVGIAAYGHQLSVGLGVTGMSRNVSWGLYIAQFTFMVGVAASAVMVALPFYLHDYRAFSRTVVLGEILAVSSVIVCITFVTVDLGRPMRVFNLFLHPTPHSVLFFDIVVLFGYLILNVLIGGVTFDAERKGAPPPTWIKPVIYLSIPWAVSIHTVTAFLYAGLVARPYWMTAIMAPRFLAGAFASGPALVANVAVSLACIALLVNPSVRRRHGLLAAVSAAVIFAIWIQKGVSLTIAGFEPSPFGTVTSYVPTLTELGVIVGVYALGLMVLTVLVRIVVNVREQHQALPVTRAGATPSPVGKGD